jgi:hypothetical protein
MIAIKLTKLSGRRGATIPVGSTVTGSAKAWPEPEIGLPYIIPDGLSSASWLDRCDWFYTTTVLKIRRYKGHRILTTKNSRWRLEMVKLPDGANQVIRGCSGIVVAAAGDDDASLNHSAGLADLKVNDDLSIPAAHGWLSTASASRRVARISSNVSGSLRNICRIAA